MKDFHNHSLKVVIFDLGFTLINFEGIWPKALEESYRVLYTQLVEAGLKLDEQIFLSQYTRRIREYYEQRDTEFIEYTTECVVRDLLSEFGYPDLPEKIVRPAINAMYGSTQQYWQIEPDTIQTLSMLKDLGYRLGLISNAGDDQDVQTLIDKAQIRHFFEQIIVSAAVGIRKPHPRIFQMAMDHFGTSPQEMAMVGDTLSADVYGANQMGMISVWITRRANRPDNAEIQHAVIPHITIATLAELPERLNHWAA